MQSFDERICGNFKSVWILPIAVRLVSNNHTLSAVVQLCLQVIVYLVECFLRQARGPRDNRCSLSRDVSFLVVARVHDGVRRVVRVEHVVVAHVVRQEPGVEDQGESARHVGLDDLAESGELFESSVFALALLVNRESLVRALHVGNVGRRDAVALRIRGLEIANKSKPVACILLQIEITLRGVLSISASTFSPEG